MASLNKLAIRGIRSFDDKQISVIEFFSPVTVIVGHNGSGKTTIIECLKYATTGDQPPNTRGGAFIHDPKIANEKEVKAQVKLRFDAANGNRMLVVRNLSVTVKKTTGLTMKTLESILALADGNADKGSKVRGTPLGGSISGFNECIREASYPQSARRWTRKFLICWECPSLSLRMSYFATKKTLIGHLRSLRHSRRSLTTFSRQQGYFLATFRICPVEPQIHRYTKALDSIKALRKDRVAELKAEKERLDSLSREKSHADKLKGRISDLNSSIATKEVEYEEMKKKYDAIVTANQQFYEYATKFRELYLKVENLQEKKGRYEVELADAKENVHELEGRYDVPLFLSFLTVYRY
jgi:DNA repair protein RAD50